VHTRWIETEFSNNLPPWDGSASTSQESGQQDARQAITVEVDGKRIEVTLPAAFAAGAASSPAPVGQPRRQRGRGSTGSAVSGDALTAPMQGTVIKVAVSDGRQVAAGDLILVLEAMKMEQPVTAHKSGTVANLTAEPGATLTSGASICTITDGGHA
jgi:acetyl-CoA/propionyl-CoA carboxylase, biotin carboxylase, biotin carboxyl carrier protein